MKPVGGQGMEKKGKRNQNNGQLGSLFPESQRRW